MTHGVFAQAIRDAFVFMEMMIGIPGAIGFIFVRKLRK